ncbi:unnamed protein product, partial [Adineta steineri]
MASRANKNHDDDASSTSSPIHSPYNLRRNHSQPGGVTKKNSFARSKHSTRDASFHTSSSRTSSITSQVASSQPERSTPSYASSSQSQRSTTSRTESSQSQRSTPSYATSSQSQRSTSSRTASSRSQRSA